jgi:hypothetical protein
MAARLGNVLYWLACIVAALFIGILIFVWSTSPNDRDWITFVSFVVLAIVSWAIGRGLRYVLAGV